MGDKLAQTLLAQAGGAASGTGVKNNAGSSCGNAGNEFQFGGSTDDAFLKLVCGDSAAASTRASDSGSTCASLASERSLCKQCLVCDEPSKGRFCNLHKKCYESIYRDAMTEASAENGDKKNFESVFGNEAERKKSIVPQPAVACQILSEFGANYTVLGKRQTEKKGKVEYSKYAHVEKTFAKKSDLNTDRWMDLELFCGQMKNCRGWSFDKSSSYFQEAWARKEWEQDMGGPAWSKERLKVKSWLLGEDRSEGEAGSMEEKKLEVASKEQKLSEDIQNKIRGELGKGFRMNPIPAGRADLQRPLMSDAFTLEGGVKGAQAATGLQILRSAAGVEEQSMDVGEGARNGVRQNCLGVAFRVVVGPFASERLNRLLVNIRNTAKQTP